MHHPSPSWHSNTKRDRRSRLTTKALSLTAGLVLLSAVHGLPRPGVVTITIKIRVRIRKSRS
jgi:hypothetical protein